MGRKAKFWFGIGASAGGLEALRGFVRNLPEGLDATYIVAQHMAPNFKSMLSEIIGRETAMPVLDVEDGLSPKAGTIYVAPPNTNLIVEKGRIRLVEPGNKPGSPKPSVSLFFTSLAKAKGKNAIGAIFSGTGSDGASGIVEIRKAGGITIAQDEHTAKYASMPIAAMETGCVDLVMSPEEVGIQLPNIIATPRNLDKLKASPLNLDGVAELIRLLYEQTRVNFRNYKSATLQRRIERRMAASKLTSLDDYVILAKGSREEVQLLFKDLLISVTSFFRDAGEFEAIKAHIVTLVKAKKKEAIRVWIAGTATGEESYSLAILFAEAMGGPTAFQSQKIQFFSTDIDSDAIEIARKAFYSESALIGQVPPEYIEKYFDKSPAGFTVKKFLREKILFSVHNTVNDPPFLNIDFISCRNLLIYFQTVLQAEAFSRFHYSLVPNGILFLGKSEAVSASETLFRSADHDKHIFFQRPSEKRKQISANRYEIAPSITMKAVSLEKTASNAREITVLKSRFESLVQAVGPNAIILNSDMFVVTAYGNVDKYLGLSVGKVDTSANSLLREPYRYEVRMAVPGVIRNQKRFIGIARVSDTDPNIRENISVYPLIGGQDEETMALVIFNEWEEQSTTSSSEKPSEQSLQKIVNLERELKIAKTNLEQISEELETSNEELQSSNEELQSSNEELQSTNEELETSNEELQSTNEELSTVNEELQVNGQQLSAVNQSLNNILSNVAVPMLVVDQGLFITNASQAAERVFGPMTDLSMPHLSRCKLPEGYPDLELIVADAVKSGLRHDVAIDNAKQSATLTVVPNISSAGVLQGAIILVTDNTAQLERARNQLQLIFDNVPMSIMLRDKDGIILSANNTAETNAGVKKGALVGQNYYGLYEKTTAEAKLKADKALLKDGIPQTGVVASVQFKGGDLEWVRRSLIASKHPEKDELAIYSISQNITDIYQAEQALLTSQNRVDRAVDLSGIGFWDWNLLSNEIYYSDRFYEITQFRSNQAESVPSLENTIHIDDRKRVMDAIKDHFKGHKACDLSFRMIANNGGYRWVDARGQAFWDDKGKPARFLGAFRDVTERHEREETLRITLEELARSNEELNRFSYVCSHDMKEPVRMIEGMAELLLSPDLDLPKEKRDELLARISNNTKRLRGIIDSLLAYSRIDAVVETSTFDLDEVLEEILEGLSLVIEEKGANVNAGKLPNVFGARVHFLQLFQNLIGNALKFNDKEKPIIKISARKRKNDHVFLVEDNGPGIPEALREEVFGIFRRLVRRDEIEGTGLGLSISKKIVEQYGGTIKVIDSKLGGIAFEFVIPHEDKSDAR